MGNAAGGDFASFIPTSAAPSAVLATLHLSPAASLSLTTTALCPVRLYPSSDIDFALPVGSSTAGCPPGWVFLVPRFSSARRWIGFPRHAAVPVLLFTDEKQPTVGGIGSGLTYSLVAAVHSTPLLTLCTGYGTHAAHSIMPCPLAIPSLPGSVGTPLQLYSGHPRQDLQRAPPATVRARQPRYGWSTEKKGW